MKKFRFELDGALRLRRQQLNGEELKLKAALAEVARTRMVRQALLEEWMQQERMLRERDELDPFELASMGDYQGWVKRREGELTKQEAEQAKRADAQRECVAAARRRLKLLEDLRERRLAEWTRESNRELDALASELHLMRQFRLQEGA
jgi:hypothetical protein